MKMFGTHKLLISSKLTENEQVNLYLYLYLYSLLSLSVFGFGVDHSSLNSLKGKNLPTLKIEVAKV